MSVVLLSIKCGAAQEATTNDPPTSWLADTFIVPLSMEASKPANGFSSDEGEVTIVVGSVDGSAAGRAVAFHPLRNDAMPAMSPNTPTQICKSQS